MKIGPVEIQGWAGLAPMAGVSDHAFRTICKEFGAGYLVSEMASAKGLTMKGNKTANLLAITETEHPIALQIFGDDPAIMAQAAQLCLPFGPDLLDINMGCPAPKIAGSGGGSALMKSPLLAEKIVKSVVKAVPIPITVKIRKGWDDNQVNAVDFARRMEAAGASALAIHGRTRMQMYAPPVDWDIIRQVKNALSIPVMANGDVTDAKSAKALYEATGADYILVGRGACGNPWIFKEINAYLEKGEPLSPPTLQERMEVMLLHIARLCSDKGEKVGMKEARKHCAWYLKGLRGAAHLRKEMGTLTAYQTLLQTVSVILKEK